jgi:hypothetical protein
MSYLLLEKRAPQSRYNSDIIGAVLQVKGADVCVTGSK